MKWRTERRSTNIEDRRGGGGGLRGSTGAKVGGGLGGLGLIAVVVIFLLGGDPTQMLGQVLGGGGASQPAPQAPGAGRAAPANDEQAQFVAAILGSTEDVWNGLFRRYNSQYAEPVLVLYEDQVQSACGYNTAATGPFYCPGDRKLYLDLSFFNQLHRMGAPGDFARAYVIGHEVAHHIQNITGVLQKTQSLQRRISKTQANQLQVLVELQADCYAGVWAHHAERERDLLERGDVEEGMRAAASIGDDTLQQRAGRRVRPETFTHGTSQQRMDWFRQGITTGDIQACDTFGEAGVQL